MAEAANSEAELIRKAVAYVSASNDHDLGSIQGMLAGTCRYESSGVGTHVGRDVILAMMESFFAGNPDVHWQASKYHLTEAACVEFDFVISMRGTQAAGVERLHFNAACEIELIEVRR